MTKGYEILEVSQQWIAYFWHQSSEDMHKVSADNTWPRTAYSYVADTGRIYEWYLGGWRRPTTLPVGTSKAIYARSREIDAEKLLGDICE